VSTVGSAYLTAGCTSKERTRAGPAVRSVSCSLRTLCACRRAWRRMSAAPSPAAGADCAADGPTGPSPGASGSVPLGMRLRRRSSFDWWEPDVNGFRV